MTRHRPDAPWTSAAFLLVIVITSCVSATDASPRYQRVAFNLSPAAASAAGFSGPYVSVVDSVDLTVTTNGIGVQRFGKRLARRDSVAAFTVTVARGQNEFSARVLSTVGTVLYSGTQSADITESTFAVDVPLTAAGPVLLVAPDTATVIQQTPPPNEFVFFFKTVVVHNRGSGTLIWSVKDTLPPSAAQCPSGCIRFTPLSDTLPAGTAATLTLTKKFGAQFGQPITFVITAGTNGEVPVVVTPF
jgi:hypothetical protein